MASINTNASAMTALQALRMSNSAMDKTQAAIATGFRVGSAKDNAAYWSIATAMRSDNKALSTVQDALGLGSATVDIAYTALESSITVADEIKKRLVAAREPGVDRTKIQSEVKELQAQLKAISESASFSGENWLSINSGASGYNPTKSIVSSFNRSGAVVTVETIDIDITSTTLFDYDATGEGIIDRERTFTVLGTTISGSVSTTTGTVTVSSSVSVSLSQSATTSDTINVSTLSVAALTDSATDLLELERAIQAVDDVISDMTDAATALGAVASRVDMQRDFIDQLMDAITRGIGQLVDADMNEESTRLQALQVQQQLGIQALSIANGNSQNILALFQ